MKVATEQLLASVRNLDASQVQNHVIEYRNKCMEQWLSSSYQELEGFLRLLEQNFARVTRALGDTTARDEIFYYAGLMSGVIQIFRQLLKAEARDEEVAALAATQSVKTDRVLACLYDYKGGLGMRHGELAETLGISSSTLTNMMKRVLNSGAAESTRAGKNVYYTLTKAGRRYWENQMTRKTDISRNELAEMIADVLRRELSGIQKKESEQVPGLAVGEVFETSGNESIASGSYYFKYMMVPPGQKKYVGFEKVNGYDPSLAEALQEEKAYANIYRSRRKEAL